MKKIFSMNNIVERKYNLKIILPNILEQCDTLYLNLIDYENLDQQLDETSKKLIKTNKVIINNYKNVGSEHRLFHFDKINDFDYYFTIDDDIIYPIDYTEKMIEKMEFYENKCLCCVHGKMIDLTKEFDYNNDIVFEDTPGGTIKKITPNPYATYRRLHNDVEVMIPGIGTSCIQKNKYTKNLVNFSEIKNKNMTDYYMGSFCKKNNIKVISIKRDYYWLHPICGFGKSIYNCPNRSEINKEIDKLINSTFK